MKMSTVMAAVCVVAASLEATAAKAATQTTSGTVRILVGYDTSNGLNNYLQLNGFTSTTTTCPVSTGYVTMRFKMDDFGKQQYSLVLAALLSGKTLTVNVDDAKKDGSGSCYLNWAYITA